MSSQPSPMHGAGEGRHQATQVPNLRCIEAAPVPAVKQLVAQLRRSGPLDLAILEVDTDMDN